jgi:membrane dipeptidase
MKKSFCTAIAIATLGACTTVPTGSDSDGQATVEPTSQSLAHKFIVVDTHIDLPYRLHRNWVDVTETSEVGEFDYPRAAAGGLDAAFMSIFIPATTDAEGKATAFADELIDNVEALATSAPDKFQIATCAADVGHLRNAGQIALPMGMENGGPIAGNLSNLDHFRSRGIRYITLAHAKWNHISDSSYDTDEHWQGLSAFGKSLVGAMNERGIMIDVSHITDKAFWQVLELTAAPVIASHSSLRHFVPGFHRNMSDDMVAAMKDNGGVVQINFGSGFVTAAARQYIIDAQAAASAFQEQQQLTPTDPAMLEFREQYRQEYPFPYASIDDVLDHIDRTVGLAGIDHVGLGSDFDGVGPTLPTDLKDAGDYPNLADALLTRGYSEQDIEKILGGNLLRVWREVEAIGEASGYPTLCKHAKAAG